MKQRSDKEIMMLDRVQNMSGNYEKRLNPNVMRAGVELEAKIAARIREHRKEQGMTLHDIAQIIGTTPQTLQRLETANMSLSIQWLGRVCYALNILPDSIMSDYINLQQLSYTAARMEVAALEKGIKSFLIGSVERISNHLDAIETGGPENANVKQADTKASDKECN